MKTLLICSSFDATKCPAGCLHSKPHEAVFDMFDNNVEGFCDKEPGTCGWRVDKPVCTCKEHKP